MNLTTIHVTDLDIAAGAPNQPCCCPVALAAVQALGLPPTAHLTVSVCAVMWHGADGAIHGGDLPEAATRWICRLDEGKVVEPLTFELEWR